MRDDRLLTVHFVKNADRQGPGHQQERQQSHPDKEQQPAQPAGMWSGIHPRGPGRASIRCCHGIHEWQTELLSISLRDNSNGIPTMLMMMWMLGRILFDFWKGLRTLPPGCGDRRSPRPCSSRRRQNQFAASARRLGSQNLTLEIRKRATRHAYVGASRCTPIAGR